MATRSVSEIRGVLCENLKNMSLSQIFDMKQTETVATIITSLITWIPGFVIMVAGAMLVVQGKLTVSYLITANGLLVPVEVVRARL